MKLPIIFITLNVSLLFSLANTNSKKLKLVTHEELDIYLIKINSYRLKNYVECRKTDTYFKEISDYSCSLNNGDLINYALYSTLKNTYSLQELINTRSQDNE